MQTEWKNLFRKTQKNHLKTQQNQNFKNKNIFNPTSYLAISKRKR